jgi:hypothetical protein
LPHVDEGNPNPAPFAGFRALYAAFYLSLRTLKNT